MKIRFGPFLLDLDTRQLTRGRPRDSPLAEGVRVAGRRWSLDRPKVLSKAVLQQRLWPETFVAEANLSNLVAEIREALGDQRPRAGIHPDRARVRLRLLRGRHDRCAGARETELDRAVVLARMGQRRFPLSAGEHVVGRDPDVEVRLDASTVSRRHARLVVTAEERCSRISAARTARFAAASASPRRFSSPMAMPSASGRCSDLPPARSVGVDRDPGMQPTP